MTDAGSETVVTPAWMHWRHHSYTPGHQWAFWYILSRMLLSQRQSQKNMTQGIWHNIMHNTTETGSETVVAPAWLYWRHHSYTPGHQWAFWYILSSMPLGQRLSQRNKTQHNTAKAWRGNCDDFSTGSSLCALEKPQPRNQIISGVLRPYK